MADYLHSTTRTMLRPLQVHIVCVLLALPKDVSELQVLFDPVHNLYISL